MFKLNDANFYKTNDGEQIFFNKNFTSVDPARPVLVFNYGLVCSNHHWQFQLDYFDSKDHQILIHDYRGHFQSSGRNQIEKITFSQMAKDIVDLCHYLGVENTIQLGHSMGVNVCLQIARDFPEIVKGMVLISGTFMAVKDVMFDSNIMEFITPFCITGLEKYPEIFNKLWSSSGINPIVKNIIHTTGFNRAKVSKEFIEIYLNRMGQLGPDLFFQLFQEMTRQNITTGLDRMKMPALIMGGVKDNVIPNHLQRTLASILPTAETYFYINGSHVPQVDFPEMTNERIELFIQKINQL
jgi:pimeloyl-ACP methyl ester carboxylesterase